MGKNLRSHIAATLTAGVILATGIGCSEKINNPSVPIDMELHLRRGDIAPWEADFNANPEKYEGMQIGFPNGSEVLFTFYNNNGVDVLESGYRYVGKQCPADTCPRDNVNTVRVINYDVPELEADDFVRVKN